MSSGEDERALLNEERALALEERRVNIEERRAAVEERRLATLAMTAAASTAASAPKILNKEQVKEKEAAEKEKRKAPRIDEYVDKVLTVANRAAVLADPAAREKITDAFNDANALRARDIVAHMEHDTMRKRKAEPVHDSGKKQKTVVGGVKQKTGINISRETAEANIKKYIHLAEQKEYQYDPVAQRIFCKLCSKHISRAEYLNTNAQGAATDCHHITKVHRQRRIADKAAQLYQSNLVTAFRNKQAKNELTSQITDKNLIYRTDVTKMLMESGVNLEVLSSADSPMRKFFQKYITMPSNGKLELTVTSHLRTMHVPLVHEAELALIAEELRDIDWVGVSFDETHKSRLWWACVLRFTKIGVMQQRLVKLAAYKHGPNEELGKELSSMVIDVLEHYGIKRKKVIHLSRDGVAVNGVAIRYNFFYHACHIYNTYIYIYIYIYIYYIYIYIVYLYYYYHYYY